MVQILVVTIGGSNHGVNKMLDNFGRIKYDAGGAGSTAGAAVGGYASGGKGSDDGASNTSAQRRWPHTLGKVELIVETQEKFWLSWWHKAVL